MKFYLVEAVDPAKRQARISILKKRSDKYDVLSKQFRNMGVRSGKDKALAKNSFKLANMSRAKSDRSSAIAQAYTKGNDKKRAKADSAHWRKVYQIYKNQKSESVAKVVGQPLEEGRTRVKRLMNKLHRMRSDANAHGLAHRAIQQYLNADGYIGDHDVPKLRTLKKISDVHFSAAMRHHSAARKLDKQVNKVSYR